MFFQNPRHRYKKLLIIAIPLFIVFVVLAFLSYLSISSAFGTSISKNKYDIESMDYHLRSNATDYQVELFKELSDVVEDGTDDLAIAESVVKNYIADAYTWDNKKGQWDVGGMCYVFSPSKINIYLETKDSFYGLLNKYIDEYGNDGLLEVSNITTVDLKKSNTQFEIYDVLYDCYNVVCEWEYTPDSRLTNVAINRANFQVIKNNDGRFEIVVNYED